jgi:hygromycin-B 7''-O-kinase
MHLLPQEVDDETYWRDLYKQPLPFWEKALQALAEDHDLPTTGWTRAGLGRNLVFLAPTTVIKLGPPCWPGEMVREAAALQFVAGRLPVATPGFVASGTFDGWDYLMQERLPGVNLWDLWQQLDDKAKAHLVTRQGELMAAVHSLPHNELPEILHFDWQGMLARQYESCARDMQAAGVDAALVAQIDAYLDATPWSAEQETSALVHGDLATLNFLVADAGGEWKITGLIDWGDVKIGPPSHDFISPGMHVYKGDHAVLSHWYRGYQRLDKDRLAEFQHIIMARSMMYYADSFANNIQKVPGAVACSNWYAMASLFWHMHS